MGNHRRCVGGPVGLAGSAGHYTGMDVERKANGAWRERRDNIVAMPVDVHQILREGVERTDAALERLLPPVTQVPASIHGAMRHSVFAGGKRLRPVLAMEAARMMAAAHGGSGSAGRHRGAGRGD